MTEQRTSMIEVKDDDYDEVTRVGDEVKQPGYDNIAGNKIARAAATVVQNSARADSETKIDRYVGASVEVIGGHEGGGDADGDNDD